MGSVTQLTDSTQFTTGFLAGVVAALAVTAWRLGAPRKWRRFPVAGVAHVVGALVAMNAAGSAGRHLVRLDTWGLAAVALAVAGGLATQRAPEPLLVGLFLVPAGAAALYDLRTIHPSWIAPAIAGAVVLGGTLAADFDLGQAGRSLGPWLLVGTALGIYVTIPDTEAARALVGVALPMMFVAFALPAVALGTGGAAGTVTLWLLIVARDGATRPGAVIGGIGSLGLFALEPLGRRLASLLRSRPVDFGDRITALGYTLVLDAAVVWWASRVAGLRRGAGPALVLTIPAAVVGMLGATLLSRPNLIRPSDEPVPPPARSPR